MTRRDLLGGQGLLGAGLLAAVLAVALYGAVLPQDAGRGRVAEPYAPPGPGLPLGSDDLGRDLFEQLIVGAGTSLSLAFIVLFILAAAFLGQSFGVRVAILALILWPVPSRVLRAAVLTAWSRGHLEVARAMGAPRWWLLARHGSYLIGPLLVPLFVRTAKVAIIYDATLSFLGLGDPTSPSWGTTLYWVQTNGVFLSEAWIWWALPPGAAITVTVLALALIGTAVEDRLNPALKEAS